MDLGSILPLALSSAAIVVSIITFWLTEFRGPNITLLNKPEFRLSDEHFKITRLSSLDKYAPSWFELDPVPLVFANYGGKSGSILALEFDFKPTPSFREFFASFDERIDVFEGDTSPPVTIDKGDNQHLSVSPQINTIDWKEVALYEELDSESKVNEMVTRALERSKEKFRKFCDFLDNSKELGKVSCTAILTKGRFKTKVKEEVILRDVEVVNGFNKTVSSLRDCLSRWEHLSKNKTELRSILVRDIGSLKRELEGNISLLKNALNERDISHKGSALKLKLENSNGLQHIRTTRERKMRWFLIESEAGLKKDLTELYEDIEKYNSSYDELMSLGDLRTKQSVDDINVRGEELPGEIGEVLEKLSQLLKRYS